MMADILTKRNVNPRNLLNLLKQKENDNHAKGKEKTVRILLVDQGMEEQAITVPIKMSFQEIKQQYLNEKENYRSKLRLILDGERLQDHDTPEGNEMEDGDVIDVFEEQLGGGKVAKDAYKENVVPKDLEVNVSSGAEKNLPRITKN